MDNEERYKQLCDKESAIGFHNMSRQEREQLMDLQEERDKKDYARQLYEGHVQDYYTVRDR